MSDDPQKNKNVGTNTPERPLDPTQNAGDLFGDTSGMTGVTQGAPQQSSAEPSDKVLDETEIKGGVIQNPTNPSPTGYPKSAVSDKVYNQQVTEGMSSVKREEVEDTASEPVSSQPPQSSDAQQAPSISPEGTVGNDTTVTPVSSEETTPPFSTSSPFGDQDGQSYVNTQNVPYMQPENMGEQDAVGGTTPDPRTDDDTLDMAQRAGFQTGEDSEHPQEIDAGRDIDKAEKAIRES